ncbi:MAG TPA: aminoglycoside phosphotransferase family protein [Sphingobacterium sp.]|nr:aminoglycoside phosphotransferase family protein [Sphingobacterium sp.]
MGINKPQVIQVVNIFFIEGKVQYVKPFGSGHINDTYKVKISDGSNRQYLLQRINHHVFPNIEGLMNNMTLVLDHLKEKYEAQKKGSSTRRSLTIVPTRGGESYYRDEKGNYWRMFVFLDGTKSYDIVEKKEQARSGGKAFGEFQSLLSDMDATKLIEVIPNFHNIRFRMDNLRKAIREDKKNRVKDVTDILNFVMEREEGMHGILKRGEAGELPLRITHNDTKFNNVLLDKDDNVQCVIDLDTVMPGYIAYDFGDAIRTIINTAAEDEPELEKVRLNIPLYQAYVEGYLSQTKSFLTDNEIISLLEGVFLLPYMIGVRFLTDYLEGDHYYKVEYPEHNLVRAKTQFKLVQEMEMHKNELKDILIEQSLKHEKLNS